MKFTEALGKLRPSELAEAMQAYRAEFGRGARRQLAADHGVTPDTAGRWLAGKQAPSSRAGRRDQVLDGAPSNQVAAQRMRTAQGIAVGTVQVHDRSAGTSAGRRNVGVLPMTAALQQQLAAIADLVENGQYSEADSLMGDAILQGYSQSRSRDGRAIPPGVLRVEDYGSLDFL